VGGFTTHFASALDLFTQKNLGGSHVPMLSLREAAKAVTS